MLTLKVIVALAACAVSAVVQGRLIEPTPIVIPEPAFTLSDPDFKPQKPHTVVKIDKNSGGGAARGTFAVYGGLPVEVSSLSFSGDGKLLAVGSTPGRVDLWDMESLRKIRTFNGGSAVSVSTDGRLLANDGKGIEIYDIASGQLLRRIERPTKKTDTTIQRLEFDRTASFLVVTANGEDDVVYDVSSGKLLATLIETKRACFSRDGSMLVGGNYQHLIAWRTKDWSKVSDFPNSRGYVTAMAVLPEKNFVVIGTSQMARLVRLSSGEELATVGNGFTHLAAFDRSGTILFMYTSSGLAVWDTQGKKHCERADAGNGTMALSPDDRWLAAGVVDGGPSISVWKVQDIASLCSGPGSADAHQ
jgi:WD40 repeat protein